VAHAKRIHATTINHNDEESLQCIGGPVAWFLYHFFYSGALAYLFDKQLCSRNEYPSSETRNGRMRMPMRRRTTMVHQNVFSGWYE